MADDELSYRVNADVSKAEKDLDKFITKLGEVNSAGARTDRVLDTLEKRGVALANSLRTATQSMQSQIKTAEDYHARMQKLISDQAALEKRTATGRSPDQLAAAKRSAEIQVQAVATARQTQRDQESVRQREIASLQQAIKQRAQLEQESAARTRAAKAAQVQYMLQAVEQERAAQQKELAALKQAMIQRAAIEQAIARSALTTSSVGRVINTSSSQAAQGFRNAAFFSQSTRAATELAARNLQVQRSFEGIANTRYALFSVARSLAVVSAATLGLSAIAIKTAADYETLFASVERVAQTDPQTFGKLKEDLIDLSTTIPGTVQDITRIATLGGQLGIAAGDIDAFTETVLKFSATTNVSADAAAESLGRVAQLTGTTADQYSNLASAIYQTGITSVATESDILAVTEQIAVSGRQAGFTADQIVALAGALASLGVAPERARGSIQRIFNIITNSVDNGGKVLDEFAKLSGQTSAEFAKQWKTDAQGAFLAFVEGLGKAGAAGENINNLLSDVGIKAVRDADALKRLAQNTEVYASAIQESSTAFDENTALTEGYAIVADTLNAKLQVLGNTLKAIMEAANNNGPLKVVVDLLQKLFNVLLAVARTETGKVILGVVVAFTALVGVLALVGAGITAVAASILAAITAMRFMTKEAGLQTGTFQLAKIAVVQYLVSVQRLTPAQGEAALASRGLSGALTGVAASSRVAAAGIKGIKYALVSTGVGIALVALGEAISWVWQKFDQSRQPVQRFTEDLQGLSQALSGDTQAVLKGTAEGVTSFTVSVDKNGQVVSDGEAAAHNYAAAMNNVGDAVGSANDVLKAQTIYVGDLTKEWLANNLITGETGEKFVKDLQSLAPFLEQAGTSVAEVFNKAIQGHPVDLSSLRQTFQAEVDRLRTQQADLYNKLYTNPLTDPAQAKQAQELYDALPAKIKAAQDQLAAFDNVVPALDNVNSTLINTVNYAEGVKIVYQALGIQAEETADDQEDLTGALDGFLATSLDASNGVAALRDNLYALGQTLAENGTTLDLNTQAGRNNYNAIQQTIELLNKQSGGNQDIFTASLQNLLNMLQGLGFTNEQLRVFHGLLGGASATAQAIGLAGAQAGTALKDGFDAGTKSINNTGKAAKNAAREIRTLSDYVSDLGKVMKDAFNFRFGLQQAKDDVTSTVYSIQKAFDDAKEKVRSLKLEIMALNATLDTLRADQSVLEYGLKVAIEYGDTLAEQEIRAKIAENQVDQAKATEDLNQKTVDLDKAQQDATATLTGNSEAAIEQRKNVLELVQATEDAIEAYAAAGHSQKEVATYARQLKARLGEQLSQWGYNKSEVKRYTAAIDDFVQIINKVPRDLTVKVTANMNPAKVALDQFFAQYKDKTITTTQKIHYSDDGSAKKAASRAEDISEMLNLQWQAQGAAKSGDYKKAASYGKRIGELADRIKANKYKTGGYTGDINPNDVAGVVHGREFVMDEAATSFYGPSQLQAMMVAARAGKTYSPSPVSGASGTGQVELSAYDRSLLLAVANSVTEVSIDGRVVATAVNKVNQNDRRRSG